MEVQGQKMAVMGRDSRHITSRVPGMFIIIFIYLLNKTNTLCRWMEVTGPENGHNG